MQIDTALVRRLVTAQFPGWAEHPVRPVDLDGWDNRTFRLGADLSVRLPSAAGYVPQVDKEHRWLPVLAPHLPLPIPEPVARGNPGAGYPYPWSVYRWLDGEPAARATIADPIRFATDLAGFLAALGRIDPSDGPPAGQHSAWRGGPLTTYDEDTRQAVAALAGRIDGELALEIWRTALEATWTGPPVWFHGDVGVGNLLVRDGRLAAVIDFGCAGVGDPACDVTAAWTMFSGRARAAFRDALAVDQATWARGRGWTLWKALIVLAHDGDTEKLTWARRTLEAVFTEYRST
ncbi:aminoglycoside phosphotransferase family protein [Plantactinospora sp. GCM10030261]|uniref:aminoglycoside phosphotransferase family protein n=1 Tax=Plantactinospora sp. GCM10030261 TaxID=3273420 RepID=UPI00361F187B